jgi:hypothetical protein
VQLVKGPSFDSTLCLKRVEKLGNLCGIVLELGLNITESKITLLYESKGIT